MSRVFKHKPHLPVWLRGSFLILSLIGIGLLLKNAGLEHLFERHKQYRDMLNNLKRNDGVVTAGGLHGKIVALGDRVVTLEIAPNVRVRVDRPQIAALAPAGADDTKEKDKSKCRVQTSSTGQCSSSG